MEAPPSLNTVTSQVNKGGGPDAMSHMHGWPLASGGSRYELVRGTANDIMVELRPVTDTMIDGLPW